MLAATAFPPATIWMVDDIPARMVFAGQRWRVSDTPTRLGDSIWSAPQENHRGLFGWRFQGTNEDGHSIVFDVFRAEDGWLVHRSYTLATPERSTDGGRVMRGDAPTR